MEKLLRRSKKGLIGGVCGGFANWFDVDPTVVRIIFAILILCYGIGVGFYILCWILMPKE
ncbi:PspC domain-containing protein [Candidatus Dojkabacteria bacterium]|jgi:phage shock protein PspC (stress-responsive transcriptional regulator)|nr:PspC domain-containing protein [Candidatus Dojkabacteria bacterium]